MRTESVLMAFEVRRPFQIVLLFLLFSCAFQHVIATRNVTEPIIVNALNSRIRKSIREVHIRRFAKIPDWNLSPSGIVGLIGHAGSLFVTTSTSGGLIYLVRPNGRVKLWFDVNAAMIKSTGRPISIEQVQHGGLRGLAFHPKFRQNGLFYVSCMEDRLDQSPDNFTYLSRTKTLIAADSVLLEFRVNLNTRAPIPTSYRQVLRVGMRDFDHPIKQIVFHGPYLYIAHGDGSIGSSKPGTGQNNDALGKILRIDPLENNGRPYSIPEGNPFNGDTFPAEVYAAGFRNPHNLCFGKRGVLFAADVGRDNIEEVNIIEKGGNYGWSKREGTFVHLPRGGLVTGLAPLPKNDSLNHFIYPAAMYGHEGEVGSFLTGQAIAVSCPIQTRSPLKGTVLYSNFPSDGSLFLSFIPGLKEAVTTGPPERLTQARTYRPKIFFDHDDNPNTPDLQVANMREVVGMDPGFETAERANVRFGRGSHGEIYISAKGNGMIYLVTSSVPTTTTSGYAR